MVKRIAILLFLIPATLLIATGPVAASTQFRDIVAQGAILAEADSGQILFRHNIDTRLPADGLTRIMTLMLAANAIDAYEIYADEPIVMTEEAWEGLSSRNTTIDIRPGEEMPFLELMYASFIAGASEASNMIAITLAGSIDNFVAQMNATAREVGAYSTSFVNTHGTFAEGQMTTAYDQFKIFSEAINSELFLEVAGTLRHTIPATNYSDARRLIGTNSLQNQQGRYFFRSNKGGIGSITFEGGHSYAGISEMDGLVLIAVILGSDEIMLPDESFDLRNLSEARRLFEWGYSQFGWRTVLATTDLVARAQIEHGAGADFVNLRPDGEIRLLLDNDVPLEEFERHITVFSVENNELLIAPVQSGTVLGEITLIRGDYEFGPIALIANTTVDLHSFEFIRRQVMDILSSSVTSYVIWGLVILIAIYFILVIRYNVNRRKRLTRIAMAKRQLAEERQHAQEQEYEERATYYGQRPNTIQRSFTDGGTIPTGSRNYNGSTTRQLNGSRTNHYNRSKRFDVDLD